MTLNGDLILKLMRERSPGFMMPDTGVFDILCKLEEDGAVYSLTDSLGQTRWYLQDDYL